MDIGLYWSPAVLEHKLERRHLPHREEVWNCRHLPKGMGIDSSGDWLVIGSQRRWVGAFRLVPQVLFNPADSACPYSLIFDANSWHVFPAPPPCTPFRGWKYLPANAHAQPLTLAPGPPSTGSRDHRH